MYINWEVEDINAPLDCIIGKDFMDANRCIFDFENNSFILGKSESQVEFALPRPGVFVEDIFCERKQQDDCRNAQVSTRSGKEMKGVVSVDLYNRGGRYVFDCVVNGESVFAFLDTGASMCIMSRACAERCGVSHLQRQTSERILCFGRDINVKGIIDQCPIDIGTSRFSIPCSILDIEKETGLLSRNGLFRIIYVRNKLSRADIDNPDFTTKPT